MAKATITASMEMPRTAVNSTSPDLSGKASSTLMSGFDPKTVVHTARKDQARDVRIFDELVASFEDLRAEMGDDLQRWTNAAGRPRIGFRRTGTLAFLTESEDSDDFGEAVSWMRDRLDRLASTFNPKLQARLADEW